MISFAVPGEEAAPEMKAQGAKPYILELGQDEFVESLSIELANYGGSADYNRESGKGYDAQWTGDYNQQDLYVFGRPYIYKGQSGSDAADIADALNTFSAAGYQPYAPDSALVSAELRNDNYNDTLVTTVGRPSDSAYYLGYLIPYQTGWRITRGQDDKAPSSIFDYQDDNNTPTVAPYEVRFWNRQDNGSTGADRSARISAVTLHAFDYPSGSQYGIPETTSGAMRSDGTFRMQHVYLPEEFVDLSGNAAYDAWFKATSIKLKANGKEYNFSLDELVQNGWLTHDEHNKRYVLDCEALLRTQQGSTTTYTLTSATNTMDGYKGTDGDVSYTKAYVSDVWVSFAAENPQFAEEVTPDHKSSALDGGEYLSPDRTSTGYAFAYDGVFVDRTTDDFANAKSADDNWNATSTPSIGKQARGYAEGLSTAQRLTVENVDTIDPNHKPYDSKGAYDAENNNNEYPSRDTAITSVSNLRAQMDLTLERGTKVSMNGKGTTVFAYDLNNADNTESYDPATDGSSSMTDPASWAPAAGAGNNIANGDLFAGDYVDYTVKFDAATSYGNKNLPLEQTDLRLEVPKGQRIVGWEIVKNDTGLADSDVSAKLIKGDAAHESIDCQPRTDYTLIDENGAASADGAESYDYNRNLVVSVGDYAKGANASQIKAGGSITLRVVTQMTDELENEPDYNNIGNDAWNGVDDQPTYAGQSLTANLYAIARPKHGYTQYDVSNTNIRQKIYREANDTGGKVTYSRDTNKDVRFDGRTQFGGQIESTTTFHKHALEGGVTLNTAFTDAHPVDPRYKQENDGSAAQLTVGNIANRTSHTTDMTVTVSFMQKVGEGATQAYYRGFELTRAPLIANGNESVKQEGGTDVALRYPVGMPEYEPRKPILVEYYVDVNEDGTGEWVTENGIADEVSRQNSENNQGSSFGDMVADLFGFGSARPTAGPLSADGIRVADSNTDPTGDLENNKYKNVTQIRWTYYDVPATSDGSTSYALEDVALVGVGRFSDTRPSTGASEEADSFGNEQADLGFIHHHHEATAFSWDFNGTDTGTDAQAEKREHGPWKTKAAEYAAKDLSVWRRVPVMQFQTQVFQTQEQAQEQYLTRSKGNDGVTTYKANSDAAQKLNYIPGETFYFKDSLWNMPRGTNAGAPNLEGELYNPVIYERIPKNYLVNADGSSFTLDKDKMSITWRDRDGNDVLAQRTGGAQLRVERVDAASGSDYDYGGSMYYPLSSKGYSSVGKPFDDIDPQKTGTTKQTDFDLYAITYRAGDGDRIAMEIGDIIEVNFAVTAATDNLPQVWLDQDGNLGTAGDQSPAYFPRVGEYYSEYKYWSDNRVNGLLTSLGTSSDFGAIGADRLLQVGNANKVMDMDLLMHDAAFSGDLPEQSDRWEMLDASYTFVPGSSSNLTTHEDNGDHGESGRNDVLLDEDSRTERNVQQVRYTPRLEGDSYANRDRLPQDIWAVTPNSTTDNRGQDGNLSRDWYELVTEPRTDGDKNNASERWASSTPLVWSETRVHLRTAWLASASQMVPEGTNDDYKSERRYTGGGNTGTVRDPHNSYYLYDESGSYSEQRRLSDDKGIAFNHYQTTLEYNQDFTAKLQALNYGDRNLDGVQMTYIMPRGVEPDFAEDGYMPEVGKVLDANVLGVSAQRLVKAGWNGSYGADAQLADQFDGIEASDIEVQVLQTPYSAYQGYDAPSDSQDPASYYTGRTLSAEKDLSENPHSDSTYEAKASDAIQGVNSDSYVESSQPWVLKITVKSDLGKWFGRGVDNGASDTSDPDSIAEGGYKINVNVPAHVFANNENGTWNDRLLVSPWDDPASGKPSPASSYYRILDIDHFEGRNATSSHHDNQVLGMDYVWTMKQFYDSSSPTNSSEWDLSYGSPNMPFNGHTVQNHSALVSDSNKMGWAAEDDYAENGVDLHKADKGDVTLYAATGASAEQRTPLVRTWATLGDDGVSDATPDGSYVQTEFDRRQLNIHVENRYWWDSLGVDYDTHHEPTLHTYATDGGSRGDLVLPVVTSVLPAGIAAVNSDGNPYPTDGKTYPLENWGISTATAENYRDNKDALKADNENIKKHFDATVTYVQMPREGAEGETEGRYVVRFESNGNDLDDSKGARTNKDGAIADGNLEARIASGGLDTFKVAVKTVGAPAYDGEHSETAAAYENVYTYVSSKMRGYKFKTDVDIAGNPFTVGSTARKYNKYTSDDDIRLDAVKNDAINKGYIPVDSINDGTNTVLGKQKNTLPGFQYRYSEENGISVGSTKVPLSVEDYTYKAALPLNNVSLPDATGSLRDVLNGDTAHTNGSSYTEKFAKKGDPALVHDDDGVLSTFKIRATYPRLVADATVEFNPEADRPGAADAVRDNEKTSSAAKDQAVDRTGKVSSSTQGTDSQRYGEALQYGDTPWYSTTLSNAPSSGQDYAHKGAVQHGRLVFAVHLPRQVTFYDKEKLTDENYAQSDQFLLEYTHYDRQQSKKVTETLTADDLQKAGWTVHITTAPDWAANSYADPDFGKPDPDNPGEGVPSDKKTVKPNSHDGETVVFEFAAPSDESDEEFQKYETLLSAARNGVRPDGYFGTGDTMTLKLKTRVDNLGAEDEATNGGGTISISDLDARARQWVADSAHSYVTTHGLDGSWIDEWDHVSADGNAAEVKPVFPVYKDEEEKEAHAFDNAFSSQAPESFEYSDRQEDSKPTILGNDGVDYDNDGSYDDIYTHSESGIFAVRMPNASARLDTVKLRSLATNPDLGEAVATDPDLRYQQELLLDQAVNMGGAVNTFAVDWQMPFYGTSKATVEDAPRVEENRMNTEVDSVSTGVWEIPGADIRDNVYEGQTDVTTVQAQVDRLKTIEDKLRVYVIARVVPSSDMYNTDYALPGTSDDRATFAGDQWRLLGSQNGYAISEKQNTTIDIEDERRAGHLDSNETIVQLRWLVKAVDPSVEGLDVILTNDDLAHDYPVPQGLRLAVDALTDDPAHPDSDGKQEADEVDPLHRNIGWDWQTDTEGNYKTNDDGTPAIYNGVEMGDGILNAAAHVTVISTPPGEQKEPLHVNHFATASPRYDDTKWATFNRSRAGFFRLPEQPYLAIDMNQYYFEGSANSGFSWKQGDPQISVTNSKMMRYELRLENLSQERIKELLGIDQEPDNATPRSFYHVPCRGGYAY